MIKDYEFTYLVKSNLDEEKKAQVSAEIEAVLAEAEAEIAKNSTGKREKLSYPINKNRFGFIKVVQMRAESEKIPELEKSFNRVEGLLRFSIIQTPERAGLKMADVLKEVEKKEVAGADKKEEKAEEGELTEEELEDKIDAALDEEVK